MPGWHEDASAFWLSRFFTILLWNTLNSRASERFSPWPYLAGICAAPEAAGAVTGAGTAPAAAGAEVPGICEAESLAAGADGTTADG